MALAVKMLYFKLHDITKLGIKCVKTKLPSPVQSIKLRRNAKKSIVKTQLIFSQIFFKFVDTNQFLF